MASLSRTPHSVNLEPEDASAASLEALRSVMRSDAPFFDETPLLDDYEPPAEADALWWSEESERAMTDAELEALRLHLRSLSYPVAHAWLDLDLEPLPLSDDRTGFFGHQREEP